MLQPHKHPTEQTNTAKKVTIQLPNNYSDNVKDEDIEESNKNKNEEETNTKWTKWCKVLFTLVSIELTVPLPCYILN